MSRSSDRASAKANADAVVIKDGLIVELEDALDAEKKLVVKLRAEVRDGVIEVVAALDQANTTVLKLKGELPTEPKK